MTKTTRKQRERLLEVFKRSELFFRPGVNGSPTMARGIPLYDGQAPISYREFRKCVHPTFGCDNAVTVPWCGMWLCIETDGYCHS